MKRFFPLLLLIFLGTAGARGEIDPAFYGHWVHSSEEEKPGSATQIYRRAESREFPASRFRMAYQFTAGGECAWMSLAPNDAHGFKKGKWAIDAADPAKLEISKAGALELYRIDTLTKEILVLVPLPLHRSSRE